MIEQQHPDLGGDSLAKAAQLAAMTISVIEAAARLRAQRLAQRADADQRRAALARLQHRAARATEQLDSTRPSPRGRQDGQVPPLASRPSPAASPAHQPGPQPTGAAESPTQVHVTIVCSPRELAGQAYPVAIDEAMATAPAAASRAMRMLTAPPVRRQLTARAPGPHQ